MTRALDWDGCVNVRDLGGLPTEDGAVTRRGAVVRSDNARRLSDAGWAALLAHGIRRVVDLRAAEELADDPPREAPVEVVRVALMGEADGDYIAALAARLDPADDEAAQFRVFYLDALERHRERVAAALAAVADAPEGGVLVHCAAGMDRTGLVVALLLRLAGVPAGEVADDYAATRGAAPREAMLGALAELEARHGGVEDYLRAAGLDEGRIARLRERLR